MKRFGRPEAAIRSEKYAVSHYTYVCYDRCPPCGMSPAKYRGKNPWNPNRAKGPYSKEERTMNSVVRWNPISNFASVQGELNRVMEDVFGRRGRTDEGGAVVWHPPVDIEEQPDRYTLHLELPGMRPEDVKI